MVATAVRGETTGTPPDLEKIEDRAMHVPFFVCHSRFEYDCPASD